MIKAKGHRKRELIKLIKDDIKEKQPTQPILQNHFIMNGT